MLTTKHLDEDDEDYLAWQEDSDPMAPGNSAPSRETAFEREARMAERDGDAAGAARMRSAGSALPPADMEFTEEEVYGAPSVFEREAEMAERDGDAAGAAAMRSYGRKGAKGGDAESYLAGYDMSALDDDPFAGSTVNDERGRDARAELESYEEPDARRELFESTPVGPTTTYRVDGTVERTPGRPAAAPAEEEGRFVPLPDDVYAAMESEPINEIDMSAMEPMVITAGDEAAPGVNDESGYWGSATDEDPTYPGIDHAETLDDLDALQGADDADATTRHRGTSLEGRGARVPGTLDMSRPAVQMRDGSTATVRSASFGTDDGEVLLPTISPDGAEWSDDEAFDAYRAGGGHLGIYDSPEAATAAAESIHESEEGGAAEPDDTAAALDAIEAGGLAEPGADALTGGAFAKTPTVPGSDPMALDANLPSEGDINTARDWDIPRRILHGLGSGLNAAAGRSTTAFRSNAEPMEEARREGIAERVGAKGATELADRRASRAAADAERLAEVRNTPTQLELDREARLAAADERDAGIASRRLDLTERELAAEEAGSAAETAGAAARRDPASAESERSRALLRAEIDTLSPGIRAALGAIDISGFTAEQADAYREDLPSLLRDRMGRRGGGSAGGGGTGARAANMNAQWVAAGLAPDEETAAAEIGAMGRNNAERALARALTGSGAGDEGTEILSGVSSPILERGEARALRAQLTPLMTGYTALGDVERILREAGGARALTDPRVMREVEPYIMALRGMVTIIQHTGTINEGERPAIDASLPSATFVNELLGGGDAATRGWRSLIERSLEGTLTTAGVPPEGVARAREILRSGANPARGRAAAGSAAPAGGGETVRVRLPDGRTGRIPRADYEAHASEMELVE